MQIVSGYDEFSPRAFPDYPGGTDQQRWLRELLREAMEDEGFDVYEWEWWHFDHETWRGYPVLNLRFEDLRAPDPSGVGDGPDGGPGGASGRGPGDER